ncbi:FtsJ-domain-containing protein [Polychaeton citri CBS 116435]|uniref:rRNA methyltransferase 2, mitochondrial n=1 Tax=Polychaeton citri CBS 116435 TaxID=1314669 RepID=A0A9P4Q804_9PEZI|nr:FtsJ-domain-containing protein [Polychaeton citri CBS 116435]
MLARPALRPVASIIRAPCNVWKAQLPIRPSIERTIRPTPSALPALSRSASSSSSTRWNARQSKDNYAKEARVAGLKSRAAFKLLQINDKYKLFKRGQTVIDLGYAPGSWTQVAVNRTSPGGRVVGIDVIPAQPPRGASSIQGNFLSAAVREEVRQFVQDPDRGRPRPRTVLSRPDEVDGLEGMTEEGLEAEASGYIEMGRYADHEERAPDATPPSGREVAEGKMTQRDTDRAEGRVVDVVISDMSAPWEQTNSTWIRSVSNPYHRMMNTSGMAFRDHAGSMDLCYAALTFSYDTLATGGHFLCKFYQGDEDKTLELRLKKLFEKVHRIKPESSRKESKEAYLVALRRKPNVVREDVLGE